MKAEIWSFVTSSGLLLDVWRLLLTNQDYLKFLICPLIKRLGWTFVSRQAAKHLKRSTKLLKHSAKLLKHPTEFWNTQPSFWGFKRKLKAWLRVRKARPHVCVITQPMLSQSATVVLQGILVKQSSCKPLLYIYNLNCVVPEKIFISSILCDSKIYRLSCTQR